MPNMLPLLEYLFKCVGSRRLLLGFGYFFFSLPLSGQNLIWSDEFETDGRPDTTKWAYDVGGHGWGNQELQYYTDRDPRNARVEDGVLIVEVHADEAFEKGYSAARLVTRGKAYWQYGYIEVRAKLPTGRGTWPAIWMLPEENRHGGWPRNGEIDIMEHVGYDHGVLHGTVHTEAFNHMKGTQKGGTRVVEGIDSDFHTYAIDWTADKIDFFVDGIHYFRFENSGQDYKDWPFDQPFHLILNCAVGGTWGGKMGVDPSIWPQQLQVDYVRVYDAHPDTGKE